MVCVFIVDSTSVWEIHAKIPILFFVLGFLEFISRLYRSFSDGTTNIDDKNTTKSTLFLCFLRRCSYLVCGWECEEIRSKNENIRLYSSRSSEGVTLLKPESESSASAAKLNSRWSMIRWWKKVWFGDFSKGYPLCFFQTACLKIINYLLFNYFGCP